MEIKRDDSTYNGVVEKDGQIVCEKCQNPDAKCRRGLHMDAPKWYMNTYTCECGNQISVKTERDEESLAYWDDEDYLDEEEPEATP